MMAGSEDDRGSHLLVVFGAQPSADLSDRADGFETVEVDLLTSGIDELREHGERDVDRITLVTPGWSHLRLAALPARLLGSASDVLIRLTDDVPRSVRATGVGPLAMKGATLELSGADQGDVTFRITRTKPMKLSEVLRGLLGPESAALPAPPRMSLTSRSLEAFAIGNPFVRYAGVDDEITSLHQTLSTVDMVLEDAASAESGGPAPSASSDALPRVRVVSDPGRSPASRHEGVLVSLPPVDTVVVNPVGFDAGDKRRHAVIVASGDGRALRLVDDKGTEIFGAPAGAPLSRRQVQASRRCRFAAVGPELGAADADVARLLAQLAVAGMPLVAAALEPGVERLLGSELSAEIRGTHSEALGDPLRREAVSVRVRRAALRHHSPWAVGRRLTAAAGGQPELPLISVVLVTRRPGFVTSALAQIQRQTWPNLEVVVGLHGDRFDGHDIEEAMRDFARPLTVVRIEQDHLFGEALNRACAAASGTYLTKWDDDDLYGSQHLEDLHAAADYSGAALVGKGSNFTVLDELGETVRGSNPSSERRVRNVAGGTFFLRRSTLEDIGGWRPLPFSVDRALLGQVLDAGGQIYRTHQMGYLLRRHGQGHTWDPGLDYFLDNATDRWPVDSPRQRLVLETELDT